jgi:dTDP-glucose 4,6-dehydratase
MTSDTHVLVTGGAGFIGSHLVDGLLADRGVQVTVLDALTYAASQENLAVHADHPRFRFVRGDVAEPEVVQSLVADVDRVVHAAAETHVDRSIEGPGAFVRTNVLGTQVVLDACRDGGRPVLLVSTDEVYGQGSEGTAFHEDDPLAPRSPYAASKAAAELLARAYGTTYGLAVTVVRGTNAFGPRQFPEKAIPVFATAALDGRTLPVYDEGRQRREWLYVTDWARACLTVLERGEAGATYNLGSGTELTNLELATRICALAGADPASIAFVEARPGHDFRYGLDDTRVRALGWSPDVPFDEGLARTVAWYRDHRGWVDAMLAGVAG